MSRDYKTNVISRRVIAEPGVNILFPFRITPVISVQKPVTAFVPCCFDQDQRSAEPGRQPFPLIFSGQTADHPGCCPVSGSDADLVIEKIADGKCAFIKRGGGGVYRQQTDPGADRVKIYDQVTVIHVFPDISCLAGKRRPVHDKYFFALFYKALYSMIMGMALWLRTSRQT